ncbi:MAG: shikimate kinase [Clostridia bacterium]|nr:shikimate kinase [Clostridia bacterium]
MKFCLLGRKLPHSYSKIIHEKAGYNYDLVEVEPNDVEKFVKHNSYDGFNVTIPYKQTVMNFLDEISYEAKAIGSVNTVKKVNGKLIGYNTDCYGLDKLFDGVQVSGKTALVLGSGGTYKTSAYLLNRKGAKKVVCVSRVGEVNYENVAKLFPDAEIIVNCTPVGMFPNVFEKPIDLKLFNKLEFVADCVYNPLRTELTLQAEKLGIKYANGLKMLVHQALKAEEIWTGFSDNAKADCILKSIYCDKGNIVLYGMPACGKSVIGNEIAQKTGRNFFDTDKMIFEKTGRSPSDIIKEEGETKFRDIETKVVCELATVSGAVISVGGGAMLRSENVRALKLNGKLIYIKRDLNLLSCEDRPLSQKFGVNKLYEERKDIYESVKDGEVTNDEDLSEIAKKVVKEYENSCDKRC